MSCSSVEHARSALLRTGAPRSRSAVGFSWPLLFAALVLSFYPASARLLSIQLYFPLFTFPSATYCSRALVSVHPALLCSLCVGLPSVASICFSDEVLRRRFVWLRSRLLLSLEDGSFCSREQVQDLSWDLSLRRNQNREQSRFGGSHDLLGSTLPSLVPTAPLKIPEVATL